MRPTLRIAAIATLSFASLSLHTYGADSGTDTGNAYHVSSTLKIGGEGRWDYVTVDAEHRLYVTRTTHTQVIDPATGSVVADIPGGSGLHGTALVPSAGRAFISDGKEAKLLVIDLKSNKLLGKIDAADDADGIIYDSGTDRVLVSCGDAAALLVLDPNTALETAKVAKVDLDGKPEFLAADGKGRTFVCMNDKNLIAVVDLKTLKVTDRWPCGAGAKPTGLAIDPKSGHLFVGCRNQKLIVMSAQNGKILAELPIGKGNDACAFDPATGLAFASCGDGTLTVVEESQPANFVAKQTVKTIAGARTMAIDLATHLIYMPTADLAASNSQSRPTALPGTFKIVVVSAKAAVH